MEREDFGKYFAYIRKKSGYKSQRQLSKVSGVNNATIARIEDGSQKVKPETLKILSKYLDDISYGELLEKAGYLDELPYSYKEDELAKVDYMEIVETINENYIRQMMKEDNKFLDEVEKEIYKVLENLIEDKKLISPEYLINLNKNSIDLNFKVQLNEKLLKIIQSKKLMTNTNSSDSQELDFDYKKQMSKVLSSGSSLNEVSKIIKYLNDNNIEIVDSKLLRNREGFAFKVTDNSMNKEGIFEGDTLICVKDSILSTSDIGIIIDDVGRLLMRKVQFHDSFLILTSSSHEPEVVTRDSIRIIGKAIQSRRNLV